MLIEFKVKNYRSIKEQQTLSMVKSNAKELEDTNTFTTTEKKKPIKLLSSATIYGPNASGKSNLLKAMKTMQRLVLDSDSKIKRGTKLPITPFLLDNGTKDEPTEFEIIFVSKEVRYQYGFILNTEKILEEWLYAFPEGPAQTWFEREYNQDEEKTDWYFGSKFNGNKKIWSESTRKNALFLSTATQLNSEQLKPVYDWFNETFHVLESTARLDPSFTYELYEQEEYKDLINKFLNVADLDIEELKITEEEFDPSKLSEDIPDVLRNKIVEDFKDKKLLDVASVHKNIQGEDIYFDFDEESDGTRKFLAFLGPWIDTLENGNVLVVDELHDNFHPLMVRFLIELFHSKETNKKHAQLIFTSHETSVMSQEIFRRDQIWFCEKKNKATELFSLVEFKPRKGVTDIEKSYFSGRYGALPYFKSIERAMGVQYVEEK
ncbi:ATP-binding protein [Halarcobacter sp.]|uniref:AAA family ATPase n=1 Tax=Halarcobacter sp. TaxID=2321133 RepID=UPI0029F5A236|nr:ATP-binding protein [Halarcobacter sp.]